jgi:hypothetical protein
VEQGPGRLKAIEAALRNEGRTFGRYIVNDLFAVDARILDALGACGICTRTREGGCPGFHIHEDIFEEWQRHEQSRNADVAAIAG